MPASFRNDLMAKSTADTKLDAFLEDNIRHETRNRRNLLVAGRVLRFLQQEGKTKAWLAEQMNVSPQHVGKILKGKGNMTLESIGKLETATGLTLLKVVAEPAPPKPVFYQTLVKRIVYDLDRYVETMWTSPSKTPLTPC